MGLVNKVMPPPTAGDYEQMIVAALRHQLSLGITSSSDCGVVAAAARRLSRGRRRRPACRRASTSCRCAASTACRQPVPLPEQHASDMLRVDTVKFLADGGLSGATAALSVHYRHCRHTGLLRFEQRRAAASCAARATTPAGASRLTRSATSRSTRCSTSTRALGPHPRGLAHRIEHFGLPDAAQLARAAQAAASSPRRRPIFIHSLGPQLPRLPARRVPAAHAIRSGRCSTPASRVALSSDAPVVEDDNPLVGMMAAVTRRDRAGHLIAPEQAITAAEALDAYTMGGAVATATPRHASARSRPASGPISRCCPAIRSPRRPRRSRPSRWTRPGSPASGSTSA